MPVDLSRILGLAFVAADLLVEVDEQERIGLVVGGSSALLGATEASLIGADWRTLVAVEDQSLIEALHQNLDRGQRHGPMPVRLSRASGVSFAELTVRRPAEGDGLAAWSLLAAPAGRASPAESLTDQAAFEDLTRSLIEASRATGLDLEIALIEVGGLLDAMAGLSAEASTAVKARLNGALRAESHRGASAAKLSEERFAVVRRRGETSESIASRISSALTRDLGPAAPAARVHSVPLDSSAASAKAMRAIRYALDDFAREGLRDDPPGNLAEAMNRSVKRTLAKAGALGVAVTQRRFTLAYQPVAALTDRSIHHHEALIRFEDGASPFAMIQMAEEFDLIEELDHAIVDQAVKRLIAPDAGALKLAVNVSGQTITSENYVEHVRRSLTKHSGVRGRLIFEITESAAIDDLPRADRHIQSLRRLGSLVCLDDFGAGAASLAYLQQLQPDIVKIDGRYVRELAANGRDAAMVRHLVKLCAELKIRTVAEMVETVEIEAVVKAAGVDYAQGWLYGRPTERPLGLAVDAAPRRKGVQESWG